jgi:hypothetical protein
MKKLVLILALAGMVGSVSATTISSLTGAHMIVSVKGDDKKKKAKKEKKAKDGDKCCSKDGEKKGGCCKDKEKAAEPKPATPQQ